MSSTSSPPEPARLFEAGGLTRLRLDLAYDGTDFFGWAVQPGQRTVAGVLGEALAVLCHRPVRLVVAGRTDTGVHATGQVAHVDVPADLDLPWLRSLNGLLPADVRVRAVTAAPPGFEARFSALARHYVYRVGDGVPDPLRRRDVLHWRRPLDLAAMADAAARLTGLRDFAAFCRARPRATTIRELQRLEWSREGDLLRLDVCADAFCHSMIRSLVGAMLAVGDGRMPPAWPASLLSRTDRSDVVVVAPAHGLCLVGVDYPPATGLAARAEATRARRS